MTKALKFHFINWYFHPKILKLYKYYECNKHLLILNFDKSLYKICLDIYNDKDFHK